MGRRWNKDGGKVVHNKEGRSYR